MGRLGEQDGAVRAQRELTGANAADFSEALARGLAVLEALGDQRRRTQADLARELGLSRATVRRAVLTLEHLGFVAADGRSYELTPRILRLASGYLTGNAVSAVVQPACERICAQLQESCSVAVLDGADAVMIARAVPNRVIAAGSGVGFRVPVLRSALGRVLLAHLDPTELAPAELLEIEENGYSYVANDVEAGFHSVAVPLRRWDGRVVAAINVGATVERVARERMLTEILDVLRVEAGELGSQLV